MEIDNRMSIEYDNKRSKNERLYLNNSFKSNHEGYNNRQKSDDNLNKHCASTTEGTSSVVFEHIVPNAVKKMWVMATESAQNDVKRDNKKPYKTSLDNGHKLSAKYGNFFISHDAAKENNESNEEVLKKLRSDAVSESTELNHAKNHWGVDLKPVSNENVHDVQRIGKVTNSRKYIHFTSDDCNLPKNNAPLKPGSRSHSVDFLNEISNKGNEYPTKLSVLQRMKNFEGTSRDSEKKEDQSEKYAYLHTKRPLKPSIGDTDFRGKSNIFYQPSCKNPNGAVSNEVSHSEKTNTRTPVSLTDLLKQDEESLTIDVVSKNTKNAARNDSNNNILSQNANTLHQEKNVTNSIIIPVSNVRAPSKKINTLPSEDSKPNIKEKHFSISKFVEKKSHIDNSKKIFKSDAVENTDKENIKTGENFNNEKLNKPVNSTVLNGTLKTLEPLTSGKLKKQDQGSENAQKSHKTIQNDIKIVPKDKQIQYNKLGQAILSTEANHDENTGIKENVEVPEIKKGHHKHQAGTYTITSDRNKDEIILEKEGISDLDINKKNDINLPKNDGFVEIKQGEKVRKEKIIETTKPDTEVAAPKTPVANKPHEEVLQKVQKTQLKETILPKSEVEKESSDEDVFRRIGKLIIMSGDERDQQLKELEKLKNGETSPKSFGITLTFLSNEVADDNEPLPPVPMVIYNEPVPKLKSIMIHDNKKTKKSKKISVNFKTGKLTTVHSYPSESSYLDDVDSSGQFVQAEDAVHRERDRLSHDEEEDGKKSKVEAMENINFITEGEDFNSCSNEESGSALLF